MSYVPSTGDQRKEMLKAVGAADYADLYKDVPQEALLNRPLDLPEGMSELEYRTLQSAGGMADLWRRVHDLDYPTSIAKIRKELSEFFEDNYTSENVTRKIALSNGRAGQTSIGESMAKLLTKYQ
jgi:hypothetical protein